MIWEMATLPPLRAELLFVGTPSSPLGTVRLVGTIRHSRGIGRPALRVLGMYAFVLLLEGSGEYGDASGLRRKVTAGDVICVFPELAHFYGPGPGEHWSEIYICFEGLLFDLWRQQGILRAERPIWKLHPVEIWRRRIRKALCAPAPADARAAFEHLSRFQLLAAEMRLADRSIGDDAGADDSWLPEALRLLQGIENEALDLKAVARRVGLSYESFRKKFARRMGIGPAAYHRKWLIDRACALLVESDRPSKEIAEELGFCDEFYFSKVFRQQTGVPPRLFRLHARGASR